MTKRITKKSVLTKWLSVLFILSIVNLMPNFSRASTTNLAVSLRKGHPAPFDGDLLSEGELKMIIAERNEDEARNKVLKPQTCHFMLQVLAGAIAGFAVGRVVSK